MNEIQIKKAVKQMAENILIEVDGKEDINTYLDGIIGAFLSMKVLSDKANKTDVIKVSDGK
jgi:hypothetical protein